MAILGLTFTESLEASILRPSRAVANEDAMHTVHGD